MIMQKYTRLCFYLVLYVFLTFIIYFHIPDQQSHLEIDSPGYDRIAVNFAENNILVDPHNMQSAPIQPVGYPFFLGVLYTIFGHLYTPVIVVQIVLGLVSCLLIFLVSLQLFDIRVANIAAFFSAINIGFLTYPHFVLAETVLLFLLLLFWWLFLKKKYFFAGLMIGSSILVKPSALLFIPVVTLYLLFLSKQSRLRVIGTFLCSAYGPIVLYMMYNYYMWGYFALAPLTSLNIYHVFFSKVLAQLHGDTSKHYMQITLKFTGTHSFDESGWNNAKKLFFDYLSKEPLIFIYVWFKNVCKSLFGLFSTQLKVLLEPALKGGDCSFFAMPGDFFDKINAYVRHGTDSTILQLIASWDAVWSFVRIIPFFLGFMVLAIKKQYGIGLLIFLFITQCLIITGFDGCARYRLICEPFIIILMSAGLWYTYLLRSKRKRFCETCKYSFLLLS
ncbi:glycosyltransferase family 39 protein [Candidatus Dependentiae bacterium]|nr:glycosyltransferase family 39 protein [Candidatus Dependentiae bacterium]